LKAFQDALPEPPSPAFNDLDYHAIIDRALADGLAKGASEEVEAMVKEGLAQVRHFPDGKHWLKCVCYSEVTGDDGVAGKRFVFNRETMVACGFPEAHIEPRRVAKQDDERCRKLFSPDNGQRVIVQMGELRRSLEISQDDWCNERG
jgi:hypothetical protein